MAKHGMGAPGLGEVTQGLNTSPGGLKM